MVSEKLKIIFDKEKITGIWWVRPEDYYRCYYFLNVTVEIVRIDHEKTIWDKSKTGFHYLTYKEGCMSDNLIARDKEYRGNLLISEKLKILFDKEKITGIWSVRPEDYYRPLGEML